MTARYKWNAEDGTPQAQERREMAKAETMNDIIDHSKKTMAPPLQPMAKVVLLMPVEDALWLRQTLHENRIEGNGSKIEVWEFDKDHHKLEMHIEEVVIRG
jgi:hypothetical protein